MLDSVIHKHLDQMDEIQNSIDSDIKNIMDNINIDAVIENPLESLMSVSELLYGLIEEEYLDKAVKQGIEFSREIAKTKKIIVSDSSNPKENEGLDDKS